MDGNKDEALKCLKIGRDALGLGDRVRALKFITKAHRLDPSLPVNDLLSTLEGANESSNSPESVAVAGAGDSDSSRVQPTGSGLGLGTGSGLGSITQGQIKIVREIKRKRDYYDILELQKSCSVEDIRKAYRKLSLKVHPDKNKATGSEEAFKKLSKAFECLSIEENRKQYDLVGPDGPVYHRQTRHWAHQGTGNGFYYGGDVDAEEIFRNFFFRGMSPRATSFGVGHNGSDEPVYRRQTRHRAHQGSGNGFYHEGDVDAEEIFRNFFFGGMNPRATTRGFSFGTGHNGSDGWTMKSLLYLLPVVLILLVSFLPSNGPEPVYSLARTYSYEHRLVTQKGISFFVKSRDFEESYPLRSEERLRLEERIEHEYLSILSRNCRVETQRLHWGYQRHTPNCDALKKFEAGLVS